MSTDAPDFTLPNAGPGPDPFSLSDLPDDVRFVVLFFQRDYYCTNCRSQVQEVADRVDEFRERDAEVVSVVPEPLDRVEDWQSRYDLPYPLLADADAAVGEAYDQPVRFGALGSVSDLLGRMPEVAIVDRRGPDPEITDLHRGRSTFDRPEIDDLLAKLDELRSDDRESDDRGLDDRGSDERRLDERGPDQRESDQRGPDQRESDQRGPDDEDATHH